jgi:hypothetical protein
MTPLELPEVMLQVVASPTIIILLSLEVSFTPQRTFIVQASLMMVGNYDHRIFIVQATGNIKLG